MVPSESYRDLFNRSSTGRRSSAREFWPQTTLGNTPVRDGRMFQLVDCFECAARSVVSMIVIAYPPQEEQDKVPFPHLQPRVLSTNNSCSRCHLFLTKTKAVAKCPILLVDSCTTQQSSYLTLSCILERVIYFCRIPNTSL